MRSESDDCPLLKSWDIAFLLRLFDAIFVGLFVLAEMFTVFAIM
jgi:hypothetical protein